MMPKKYFIRSPFLFLFCTYVLYLVLFTGFRYLFFFQHQSSAGIFSSELLMSSWSLAIRFDAMVSAYLVMLPLVLLLVNYFLKSASKKLTTLSIGIINISAFIILLICCTDIPYYKFFKSRITTSVLLWAGDFGQSISYVLSDKKFYPLIALLFIVFFLIVVFVRYLKNKLLICRTANNHSFKFKTFIAACTILLVIHSARGFHFIRPPGIREAFFSNNAFINQLTLNPMLTFFESLSLFRIDYMEDEQAIALAQYHLGVKKTLYKSPIARLDKTVSAENKKNVVLILMEGMSAGRMKMFGEQKNLTPFLDSLAMNSLFFPNIYSNGIHTCNGVYGTLCSFPSLMAIHPMSNVQSCNLYFDGMLSTMKNNGYTNLLFCSHDDQFDNMGYFLPRNGLDRIYGWKDYPKEKIENVWGVNDEFLFDFALKRIDSLAKQDKKFFTTILTISTHPPQEMPKQTSYKPRSIDVFDQVFEYADWALKQFMKTCASKDWFDNTLFVFVADHGISLPSKLEAPLSLNHVPLIIYSSDSAFVKKENKNFGMQSDIYPTVMSLLGISYANNTMGVNLLQHQRPFAYFSQDNRLGVINDNYYLVIDKYGSEYLYQYRKDDMRNYIHSNTALTDSMKNYAYSMLQTTQWLIEKKLVGNN